VAFTLSRAGPKCNTPFVSYHTNHAIKNLIFVKSGLTEVASNGSMP